MHDGNRPRGSSAVMARRAEPPDSLDWFPTPPWATRALLELVLFEQLRGDDWPIMVRRPWLGRWGVDDGWPSFPVALSVLEPAAGEGHMAEVLREYFDQVHAADVFDYGTGYAVASFIGDGVDVLQAPPGRIDWVITNPPFNLALDFALRGLEFAREGVALLVRSVWLEGAERYRSLFAKHPPAVVAQFVERVPITRGRWDPDASTATAYSWFVWSKLAPAPGETRLALIPPGQRAALTRQEDRTRFAAWSTGEALPLFGKDRDTSPPTAAEPR